MFLLEVHTQTNIFLPGASWAPKIKLLGAQPKTKEPRVWQ